MTFIISSLVGLKFIHLLPPFDPCFLLFAAKRNKRPTVVGITQKQEGIWIVACASFVERFQEYLWSVQSL